MDSAIKQRLVEAAARIGARLCRDAIRHGGQVNWVGRTLAEADLGAPTVAALDGSLYDGTAGVGLFLAELSALTDDARCRDTALAALRHALARAPGAPGLYGGRAGAGLAAWRVGGLLGDATLRARGEAMVLRAGEAQLDRLDLLDGIAGVVLALLSIDAVGPAARLGATLASQAIEGDAGVSWDNALLCGGGVGPVPLVGLSHGAGGPGVALLALYARAGDRRHLRLGLGALRYEDRWFKDGNWADLRGADAALRPEDAPRGMVTWCHGAGGCGLARAAAMAVVPDAVWLAEGLRAAADTALARLASTADTSLCHGGGGLTETLHTAARALGEPRYADTAASHWMRQIRHYGRRDDWPSGLPSRAPNPSLMVGMAGTGHALLRLAAPEVVASALLLGLQPPSGPP